MRFRVIFSEDARAFLSSLPVKARHKHRQGRPWRDGQGTIQETGWYGHLGVPDAICGDGLQDFGFWDVSADTLVIATNGFTKKTQKTPQQEIGKAEKIRARYFETKYK